MPQHKAVFVSKLWCMIGRNGDLIGQIPMLYADYLKTKERQRMMVAKEFAPLLDGCSYIEPVIFDGDYKDLGKAVNLAKGMSDDVVVTSLHGTSSTKDYVGDIEKYAYAQIGQKHATAENFQAEQWKLAGRLDEWYENLPLVFDRRDKDREDRLLKANGFKSKGPKKPVILLAVDGGQTAPFPYAQLLKELVTLKFGKDYRVIDLPMVEKPDGRIYDLLALYEQAALLIAIDSQCLHLAMACPKLPVFALANDRPSLWHGAAWRPNHLWFCRYHDWPERAVEMCLAIAGMDASDASVAFVRVCRQDSKTCDGSFYEFLNLRKGMVGREAEGFPFVRDAIRMAMQRAKRDSTEILLSRESVHPINGSNVMPPNEPCYAYRIHKGQFHPIVDLFSAPKAFWKKIMPEIPDLILDDGSEWSQALMVLFKKYGATDQTGVCEFVGNGESK